MTTIIYHDFKKSSLPSTILREIATMMEELLLTGEAGTIDVRSLPLTDFDRFELAEKLGDGEVRAFINTGGSSTVFETKFAGVWWVRHEDAEGRVIAEQIVVARAPELLLAHPSDIDAAHARLNLLLARNEEGDSEEAANG
jgi:hydrogenase-1 operon protein HyaF